MCTAAALTRRDICWALTALRLGYGAGSPTLPTVSELAALRSGTPVGALLEAAAQRLADGSSLADALGPELGADVHALLRTGEAAGQLHTALDVAADLVARGIAGPADDSIRTAVPAAGPTVAEPVAVLAALLDLGAPLTSALETAAGSAADPVLAAGLRMSATTISAGRTLSDGLRGAAVFAEGMEAPGAFPQLLIELVDRGEQAGNLTGALRTYLSLN